MFFDAEPVCPVCFGVCFFVTRREVAFSTVFLTIICTPLFCNFLPVFCFGFPGACLLALFPRTKLFTLICSDSSRSPKAIFVWLPGGGNVFPLAMGPRHACPETPLFFWLGYVAGCQAVLPLRGSFAFDVLPGSFAVFPQCLILMCVH